MKLTRQEFFTTLGAVAAGVSLAALDQRSGPRLRGSVRHGRLPTRGECSPSHRAARI